MVSSQSCVGLKKKKKIEDRVIFVCIFERS